jgi:hypothetical protein
MTDDDIKRMHLETTGFDLDASESALVDFARALLASKPAIIGASDRTEIFSSNLQRTREQWEKCDPEAMSKMSQAAVFHALNDAKRDVLMMHALLAAPQQPAQSAEQDEPYGYAPENPNGNYFTRNKSTADYVGGMIPVYARAASTQSAAPQPAQTQVALTDEQIWQSLKDIADSHTHPDDVVEAGRALLAAQPVSGGKS